MEEGAAFEEEEASSKKDERFAALSEPSSPEADPQSSPSPVKATPSTPTFQFR